MADFIAIDFETANEHRASACAVALVFFKKGRISEEYHWLIRPPRGIDYFNPFNIRLHGISSRDVADQPQFNELWPEIYRLINNEMLAAHNASFDISVLRRLLDVYNLRYPELEFVCTCNIARRTWGQLTSYSLNVVADHLGYRFKHHDALDDAITCGRILIEPVHITTVLQFMNWQESLVCVWVFSIGKNIIHALLSAPIETPEKEAVTPSRWVN